jgi:hypothetical protein
MPIGGWAELALLYRRIPCARALTHARAGLSDGPGLEPQAEAQQWLSVRRRTDLVMDLRQHRS